MIANVGLPGTNLFYFGLTALDRVVAAVETLGADVATARAAASAAIQRWPAAAAVRATAVQPAAAAAGAAGAPQL